MTVREGSGGAANRRQNGSSSSGSGMSSTLASFYQNLHRVRMEMDIVRLTRSTLATLKVLIFFDACYMVAGIVLLSVGLFNEQKNKDEQPRQDAMKIAGGIIGAIALFTFACNSLAVHGLRTWRRGFLVPWLVLWLCILGVLIFNLCSSIFFLYPGNTMPGFRQALELIFCFCVFSVWCNMRKQFALMAHPRDSLPTSFDIENFPRSLFGGVVASSSSAVDPNKDLPPKYEDCTDAPPAYNYETMAASDTTANNTTPPAFAEAVAATSNNSPAVLTVNVNETK